MQMLEQGEDVSVGLSTEIRRDIPAYTANVVAIANMSAHDRAAWLTLRAANPALYSPYFHPSYAELVATLRPDVNVLIVRSMDGAPIAFLPFQGPAKGGFARPVGAPLTDYHGFICAPDTVFVTADILREAGLGAFHFSTLIDTAGLMAAHTLHRQDCTMMTLADGAETWRAARDGSYRRHLKSHRRRIRKAEEEHGARRFEFKNQDADVFNTLIKWKREKFAETGKYDVLSVDWTLEVLKRLRAGDAPDLDGDMHALYFGDRLAAVDFGLSDGDTFHSWIVAYDSDLHTLAPGIQLLEGLIDATSELGYSRIDLGSGTEGYKRHYATDPVTIGSGYVAVKGPAAAISRFYAATESLAEKAPIGSVSKLPGKVRRRYGQIRACDDSLSGRAKAMFQAVASSGKAN